MSGTLIPIVIDLETTGIDLDHDSIVQLAAVMIDLDTGRPITLLSMYCNPGRPIDPGAAEVHGIKDEDVQWATPAQWALSHLKLALDKLEEGGNTVVICGQNHERFDIPMMDRILPSAHFNEYLSVDTYTIALREWPEMPHKLGELYEWYVEKTAINAHDAAADCYMVAEILLKYMGEHDREIITLANELEQPHVLDKFPFGKHKGMPVDKIPSGYLNWCRVNFTEVHKDVEATICDALECESWIK
jgi:DNA polymerase III epsilon subunit-like protein